jgi:signal transduction histidine kinase
MTARFLLSGIIVFLGMSSIRAQTKIDETSWATIKAKGKGTIVVYWHESKPFIFKNAVGQLKGIEPDLLEGFRRYLKKNYRVDLQISWKETPDFGSAYTSVRNQKKSGYFGASAFSITPEREKEVAFSPPYMPDITVIISSKNIPVVKNPDEFNQTFDDLTAVTIRETTYEQDLFKLRDNTGLPFHVKYVASSDNLLEIIAEMDSAFGFIDLPVYLMMFNNDPSVAVNRQNLFPVKRPGYAFIYPITSDWSNTFGEYFYDENFKTDLETIISRYIDPEIYHFVESVAIQNDPIILLTKEKEIQERDLLGKARQIVQETKVKNYLAALSLIILVFLIIIFLFYKKRNEQKKKIEAQSKSIALKSEQLEKRNLHLVSLNEEKNNLIKILAHDLRTPIHHVQGLAQIFLLSNEDLPEDQKMIIRDITDAAVRLNKMITNILDIDALENERVKIFMDEVKVCLLMKQVIKSFEKQALKKAIHLSFVTDNEGYVIKGDSLFLTQIFENLLSNAIKFSTPEKKVEVAIAERDGKIIIRVKDQGPGLTEQDLGMLFQKFQRLSSRPTGGESSTGLGLSIVKKYVELMHGRVWCESTPPHGSTFIVEFDCAV